MTDVQSEAVGRCRYCGGTKRFQIVSPVSDGAWADCFCTRAAPDREGLVARLLDMAPEDGLTINFNNRTTAQMSRDIRAAAAILAQLPAGYAAGVGDDRVEAAAKFPSYSDFERAIREAFEANPWWKRRVDGTPLANDLPVIAATVAQNLLLPFCPVATEESDGG